MVADSDAQKRRNDRQTLLTYPLYILRVIHWILIVYKVLQKAQLSQRDRAKFRVIEYFAKSLKITQGHGKWHCWVGRQYKSLLVFHQNYVCISYRFWDIQRQRMAWPWNRGWGHLRSMKIAPFDRLYDFLLVRHCNYSSMLYQFPVIYLTISSPNHYDCIALIIVTRHSLV